MDELVITMLLVSFMVAPVASIGAWLVRRDALRLVLMTGAWTGVALWLVLIWLVFTGWHDLGGVFDCWPSCSPTQEAARIAFWLLPAVTFVLGLVSAVSLLPTQIRARGSRRAPESGPLRASRR